jgi:hypothetical protein
MEEIGWESYLVDPEGKEAKWEDYLRRARLAGNKWAWAVAEAVGRPEDIDPDWFRDAVEALEMNEVTSGRISQEYARTGSLTSADISAAIRSWERHRLTSYEELLERGVSREEAREIAERERRQRRR